MSTIQQLESEFLNIMAIGKSQMEYCNTTAATNPNPELISVFGDHMTVDHYKTIYKPAFCIGIPSITNAPITKAFTSGLCAQGIEHILKHPLCDHQDILISNYIVAVENSIEKSYEISALESVIKAINKARVNYSCYANDKLSSNNRICYNLTGTSLINDEVFASNGVKITRGENCTTDINCGFRFPDKPTNLILGDDHLIGELLAIYIQLANH